MAARNRRTVIVIDALDEESEDQMADRPYLPLRLFPMASSSS